MWHAVEVVGSSEFHNTDLYYGFWSILRNRTVFPNSVRTTFFRTGLTKISKLNTKDVQVREWDTWKLRQINILNFTKLEIKRRINPRDQQQQLQHQQLSGLILILTSSITLGLVSGIGRLWNYAAKSGKDYHQTRKSHYAWTMMALHCAILLNY